MTLSFQLYCLQHIFLSWLVHFLYISLLWRCSIALALPITWNLYRNLGFTLQLHEMDLNNFFIGIPILPHVTWPQQTSESREEVFMTSSVLHLSCLKNQWDSSQMVLYSQSLILILSNNLLFRSNLSHYFKYIIKCLIPIIIKVSICWNLI